jgi:hypothetical protein
VDLRAMNARRPRAAVNGSVSRRDVHSGPSLRLHAEKEGNREGMRLCK